MTKTARCYCGVHFGRVINNDYDPDFCKLGHDLIYPLYTNEHNCKDYQYDTSRSGEKSIEITPFNQLEYRECLHCAHSFIVFCDGKQWIPVHKKDGICEFFRDVNLICRNAVPTFQYGDGVRNNYCKLPPRLRQELYIQDRTIRRPWKWMCPEAHTKMAESFKCYKPLCESIYQSRIAEIPERI